MRNKAHGTLRSVSCGAVTSHAAAYIEHLLEIMLLQDAGSRAGSVTGTAYQDCGNMGIKFRVSRPQIRKRNVDSSLDMRTFVLSGRPDINEYHAGFSGAHIVQFLH